jgi:hypothetical protein
LIIFSEEKKRGRELFIIIKLEFNTLAVQFDQFVSCAYFSRGNSEIIFGNYRNILAVAMSDFDGGWQEWQSGIPDNRPMSDEVSCSSLPDEYIAGNFYVSI